MFKPTPQAYVFSEDQAADQTRSKSGMNHTHLYFQLGYP